MKNQMFMMHKNDELKAIQKNFNNNNHMIKSRSNDASIYKVPSFKLKGNKSLKIKTTDDTIKNESLWTKIEMEDTYLFKTEHDYLTRAQIFVIDLKNMLNRENLFLEIIWFTFLIFLVVLMVYLFCLFLNH
jgi:hypothetical protein